jgi:membrane protein required for colicin V production
MVSSMTLTLNDISTFDWIIAAILALFLLRGLCIGFVRQLAASVALIGSYWLAGEYVGEVIPLVKEFIQRPGAVFLVSFVGLFLLSLLLFALIGQLLHKMLEVSLLGWTDRLAGGILGVARGAVVVTLLHMFLSAALPPLFADALTVPYLDQGAAIVRQFIRNVSVRDDLKPRPPEKVKKEQGSKAQPAAKVMPGTIPDSETPAPPVMKQEQPAAPR